MTWELSRAWSALARHPWRVLTRLTAFSALLPLGAAWWIRLVWQTAGPPPASARAQWISRLARRALRILRVECGTEGEIPRGGWIASNHLGYLDVLVLAALAPAVFVAKSEIRQWPGFGWFARRAGTVFVERRRRTAVRTQANHLLLASAPGSVLVLFPEGTSSPGRTVLPFKSALLEPACSRGLRITPAALRYELPKGADPATDVCYWGDTTLAPHLLKLMSLPHIVARVRFGPPIGAYALDRKSLARLLHRRVSELHASFAPADPAQDLGTAVAGSTPDGDLPKPHADPVKPVASDAGVGQLLQAAAPRNIGLSRHHRPGVCARHASRRP